MVYFDIIFKKYTRKSIHYRLNLVRIVWKFGICSRGPLSTYMENLVLKIFWVSTPGVKFTWLFWKLIDKTLTRCNVGVHQRVKSINVWNENMLYWETCMEILLLNSALAVCPAKWFWENEILFHDPKFYRCWFCRENRPNVVF